MAESLNFGMPGFGLRPGDRIRALDFGPAERAEMAGGRHRRTTPGTFTRQLFLGESLDPDGMTASFDKGVLTLTIPVSEKAQPPRVQVTAAAASQQAIDTPASAGADAS